MRFVQTILPFAVVLSLAPPRSGAASPAAPPKADAPADPVAAAELTLRAARVGVDGPALLDYFRKRTLADADRDRIKALVRRLGDNEFDVREKALADLQALGSTALPVLRDAAANDPDVEVRRRAERCCQLADVQDGPAVQAAAARLVAVRKPEGAAAVLLAYLPFASDEGVVDEARAALAAVALRDGKPEAVLVQALTDKAALKRAAAAEALGRAGAAGPQAAVRTLLQDPVPDVRLRAALALLRLKDRQAVPALIDLLGRLPPDQVWQAEEALGRLAGDRAPDVAVGADAASRRESQRAWAAWWRDHGAGADLARYTEARPLLGYTLLAQADPRLAGRGRVRTTTTGRVLELDADKKVRWQIDNLMYPVDAQVLSGDRVLVTEYQGRKVCEYTFKGELLWQKAGLRSWPLAAQRLANGNTFIVTQGQLLEVDKDGAEVWVYNRPAQDLVKARKLRSGEVAFITNAGQYTRLDPKTNTERKSFPVGPVQLFGTFDVLPNGRVVVPQGGTGQVVEYDPNGKPVWQAAVGWPNSAERLPDGNTLVTSQSNQAVVEVDRAGKVVWQHLAEGQVFQARRR
jgi:HEAT repeat protein